MLFKNILFASSGTAGSDNAAKLAFGLAEKQQAELTLYHCCGVPSRGFTTNVTDTRSGSLEQPDEAYQEMVREELNTAYAYQIEACTRPFRMELSVGMPSTEILRYARQIKPDLIVMGASSAASDPNAARMRSIVGNTVRAVAKKAKAVSMYEFEGLGKNPVTESTAGNIICLSGIGDITIGDTICAPECVEPLPFVKISAPTMEMTFSINDSPYAGREGKFVTSRQLRDRLFRETLKDVSLRVTELKGSTDAFNVAGRGEMSLSILIETMRREGYEFQVSPPRVLYQMIDGKKCEPIERLVCDVPQEYVGAVIEKLGSRKGDLAEMTPIGSRMKLEFLIPARGLFGYRNEFLTDTKGEGIMASVFDSYAPYKGELARRNTGSLVASETGTSITYGLFNAQERGVLFIGAGVDVYEGMVVGQSPKQEDITVNVCKKKQLTNMRASGSDDALRLVPPKQMSLEQCLEFLADDELLEVTPKNLRIRKTILNKELRMKATHGNKKVLQ